MSFSLGRRNCVGQCLVIFELHFIIARLCSNYFFGGSFIIRQNIDNIEENKFTRMSFLVIKNGGKYK